MKSKQTESTYIPIFFLCLCLAFLCYGCLGLGGSGGGGGNGISVNPNSSLSISGKAFFYERRLYGNIPIVVKNMLKETVAVTTTDSSGNYAFSNLQPGVYYVSATTGESEVTFANMIQVTNQGATEISPTALLCIKSIIIDKISSDSFHIEFDTNRSCRATLEYGPSGGYIRSKTIGQAGQTHHEITLTGLNLLTEYEVTIYMTGDDGQEFVLNGLTAKTIGLAGSSNLAVNINNGAYETSEQSVTLNLYAENCKQMKISESYTLDDASWVNYSETYRYTFNNKSSGIKRVYVQFMNENGTLSPIESDSIVYSSTGYLGIWINDGEAITNKYNAEIKAIYPNALQMMISESPNFSNAFWESYISTRKWTFSNDEGLKTIYCKFKGGSANPEEVFTASIMYDATPPKVEIIINDGKTYTSSTTVKLDFTYSNIPSQMKISNTEDFSLAQEWLPFKTSMTWDLQSGDGNKTVFGMFKDAAGNEYGPVTCGIIVDTTVPTGNTISIRESDSSSSPEITETLIDDLPRYLHFSVSDTSTYKAYYTITVATTTVPSQDKFLEIFSPFNPVELTTSNLKLGNNKLWCYFADEAGNLGSVQSTVIRVDGPEIILSPETVTLISEQEQEFTYTLNNIATESVGIIKWSVASGSGTITSTGLYVAPSPIYDPQTVIIRGTSSSIPTLYGIATISLETSTEITYLQTNGSYTKEPLAKQISPGETVTYNIYTLHSVNGIRFTSSPAIGEAVISNPVATEYGSIATITYTAPDTLVSFTTVTMSFCSKEEESVTGKVTCTISNGANITLTPSAYISQRNSPITVEAKVTNTDSNTIDWSISPINSGSFSPSSTLINTTTTYPNHIVTFYPSSPAKITQASITASIGEASKTVKLSVYPPLSITIDPIATDAMPIAETMSFSVNSFEYMVDGTKEDLIWEFKNANAADFMPADGKQYADRGTLTLFNNNTVNYKRPPKLPSSIDDSASDIILIRATSVADPLASSTATVRLAKPVVVELFENVEKTQKAENAATVIEVGSLQFYASVTPEVIGNTSVTWTVNGVSNSDIYGSIDSNGKYTAPSSFDTNKVTIRATSNYDSSAYAEVNVSLSEFWVPKRQNMVDTTTGEPMPISKVFVDPRSQMGDELIVYAGTSAENKFGYYGLWVATFSDAIGDTSGGYWTGINGLSATTRTPDLELLIYDITMDSDGDIYASTGNGLYYIPPYGTSESAIRLNGPQPAEPLVSIDTAKISQKKHILAGGNQGVYEIILSNKTMIESCELLIYTQQKYKVLQTRDGEVKVGEDASGTAIMEPRSKTAFSFESMDNPIQSFVRSVRFDNLNRSLYFGTSSSQVFHCPSLASNMDFNSPADVFSGTSGIEFDTLYYPEGAYSYPNLSYPNMGTVSAVPLAIALDVINTNTLWVATTNGVARSIDYGRNWTSYSFSGGTSTNCKCILVDPNNTINVMSGSEDGLYRSTNGGSSWTRIRSGLGNFKTITSLTQAAGAAGQRRKVWVGTSGGVFIGKQSLSLD